MEKIGKSVERVLARSGGGTALALTEITAVWPEAVGEAVAREAWPLRVARDGTLHVATTSSTWAFELDRLSPEIEEQLRALLGLCDAGEAALPGRPGARARSSDARSLRNRPSCPREVTAEAASLTAEIEDPELRELVARAARASLSRASSGRRF